MNAELINLLISIIAIVGGAFGISEAVSKALKSYKDACQEDLAIKRDINHLKNHLATISKELDDFETEVLREIKEIQNKDDQFAIAIAEIKIKLDQK